MAKVAKVATRFMDLAWLLVQIMVESDSTLALALEAVGHHKDTPFDPEIPDRVVRKTALSLQRAFKSGALKEDAEQRLYYSGMVDEFGGYISEELERQAKLLKPVKPKHKPKVHGIKRVLVLRDQPVTMAVPSDYAVIQVDGYDMVKLQVLDNRGAGKAGQVTDKEYQAIIDHLAQIFPIGE